MPIRVLEDGVLTIAEAAAVLPPLRKGGRVHVSTVYRWIRRGCEGVRLEGVEATIESLEQVMVLFTLSIVTQHSQSFSHSFVACHNYPAISISTQVLSRIEAKSCCVS